MTTFEIGLLCLAARFTLYALAAVVAGMLAAVIVPRRWRAK